MKRIANSLTALLILMFMAVSYSSAADSHSTATQGRIKKMAANAGFYISFEMCHACAYIGWQRDIVSALGKADIKALVSDDVRSHYTPQPYWTLNTLQLRGAKKAEAEEWSLPVYAGPFESKHRADRVFSQLPSILNTVFDEVDKQRAGLNDNYNRARKFHDCTGNQCDIYGFFVQLVRVQR
jgi:hypothetical protein